MTRTEKLEALVRAALRLRKRMVDITPLSRFLCVHRDVVAEFDAALQGLTEAPAADKLDGAVNHDRGDVNGSSVPGSF